VVACARVWDGGKEGERHCVVAEETMDTWRGEEEGSDRWTLKAELVMIEETQSVVVQMMPKKETFCLGSLQRQNNFTLSLCLLISLALTISSLHENYTYTSESSDRLLYTWKSVLKLLLYKFFM
jgi:hypothetical protein